MNRLQTWIIAGTCLVLSVFGGFLSNAIEPVVKSGDDFSVEGAKGNRQFMAMTLFGQLRVTMNKYFWLRTEDYLHFGLTRNSYTRREFERGMADDFLSRYGPRWLRGKASASHPKTGDWRGFFKNFDYTAPIKGYHGNPNELLPWYRMQTTVNPNDTSAYVNGAFFLADFNGKFDEALAFLQEGIANNPESPEVNLAIGRLYIEKWGKYKEALPYLEKAVANGREIKDRDLSQERTVGNAYVFLIEAYRKTGDLESALKVAQDGLVICPKYGLVRASYRLVVKDIEKQKER